MLAAVGGFLGVGAGAAHAGTFPVIESFENSTAPGWVLGGNAVLTATTEGEGNGWLRLTPAQTSKSGYAFYDEAFSSSQGIVIDFDYASYGGTGADGITFFLYDGATPASQFRIGAFGGSLGYSSCGSTPGCAMPTWAWASTSGATSPISATSAAWMAGSSRPTRSPCVGLPRRTTRSMARPRSRRAFRPTGPTSGMCACR